MEEKIGTYSQISDPKNVGVGKNFTVRQKREAIKINLERNNGIVRSDQSGIPLVKPQKSMKGVTPKNNEWQFDHIISKKNNGTNSSSNIQILSRQENRIKSWK